MLGASATRFPGKLVEKGGEDLTFSFSLKEEKDITSEVCDFPCS